jgi:hypothetical protein
MAFWTQGLAPGIDIMPKMKDRFIIVFGGTDSSYAQNILFSAKSVTKPTINIETKEFQLINHKFKYPGIATWQPIKITFVDMAGTRHGPVGRNSSKKFGKAPSRAEATEQFYQDNPNLGRYEGTQNRALASQRDEGVAQTQTDMTTARNGEHVADFLDDILQRSGYDRPTYHPGNTSPRKSMMNYYLSGIRIQQIDTTPAADGKLLITEEWELINPIIKSISWGDLAYGDDGLVVYSLELDYDYATFRYGDSVETME